MNTIHLIVRSVGCVRNFSREKWKQHFKYIFQFVWSDFIQCMLTFVRLFYFHSNKLNSILLHIMLLPSFFILNKFWWVLFHFEYFILLDKDSDRLMEHFFQNLNMYIRQTQMSSKMLCKKMVIERRNVNL